DTLRSRTQEHALDSLLPRRPYYNQRDAKIPSQVYYGLCGVAGQNVAHRYVESWRSVATSVERQQSVYMLSHQRTRLLRRQRQAFALSLDQQKLPRTVTDMKDMRHATPQASGLERVQGGLL